MPTGILITPTSAAKAVATSHTPSYSLNIMCKSENKTLRIGILGSILTHL